MPAVIATAQALIAATADRDREVRAAWLAGFETGYENGYAVGYGRAEHEMDQSWAVVSRHVRHGVNDPKFAELEARRTTYPKPALTPDQIIAHTAAHRVRVRDEPHQEAA